MPKKGKQFLSYFFPSLSLQQTRSWQDSSSAQQLSFKAKHFEKIFVKFIRRRSPGSKYLRVWLERTGRRDEDG